MKNQVVQFLQVSTDDLKEIVKEAVKSVIPPPPTNDSNSVLDGSNLDPKDDLLTAKEVRHILKISATTLWRFNKSGTLKIKKKIGRKIYYSKRDVNNLINDSSQ